MNRPVYNCCDHVSPEHEHEPCSLGTVAPECCCVRVDDEHWTCEDKHFYFRAEALAAAQVSREEVERGLYVEETGR